jgi:hypothetical protein
MDEHKTMVVFRWWKPSWHDSGDIIALFPCDVDPNRPYHCMSYGHIGQHGMADYQHIIGVTRAATPEEYRDLAEELKGIGYNLAVKQHRPSAKFMAKWLAEGNA